MPNGPAALPLPGSALLVGIQTTPPARPAAFPAPRGHGWERLIPRPPDASCAPTPEARMRLRHSLGVARAFGPTPCVTPKPGEGSTTPGSTGQTGLKSLWYPTHSHASESLHSGSLPTHRDDPPAGGVPRKLAGRSPGAANRHPSGTLLCLHVSKPGSDGPELNPLLPLDATRSSPCRRLGYIVTEGPATTSNPYMHMGRQPQRHPFWGPTSAYTCPLPGTLPLHLFPLDATRSQWAAASNTL